MSAYPASSSSSTISGKSTNRLHPYSHRLTRKSLPTLTLNLASVSAHAHSGSDSSLSSIKTTNDTKGKGRVTTDNKTMQVGVKVDFDFDLSAVVPVPSPSSSLPAPKNIPTKTSNQRTSSSRKRTHAVPSSHVAAYPQAPQGQKNIIPFPRSYPGSDSESDGGSSSSSSTSTSSTSSASSSSTSATSISSGSSSYKSTHAHALLRSSQPLAKNKSLLLAHAQAGITTDANAGRRVRKTSVQSLPNGSRTVGGLTATRPIPIPVLRSVSEQERMPTPLSLPSPSPSPVVVLPEAQIQVQVQMQMQIPPQIPELLTGAEADTDTKSRDQDAILLKTIDSLLDGQKQKQVQVQQDPPPYSLPPPPYSATVSPPPNATPNREDGDDVVLAEKKSLTPAPVPVDEKIVIVVPKPIRSGQVPISVPVVASSSSSNSPSHHAQQSSQAQQRNIQPRRPRISSSELKLLVYLYRTVMYGVEKRYRRDVVGRRGVPMGSGRAVGAGKENANGGFARFPLVEDDGDEEKKEKATSKRKYTYSAAKAEQAAQLDVQDALLAIRLRGFLRAQGVNERELDVRFEGEVHAEEDEEEEKEEEEGPETIVVHRAPEDVDEEEEEEEKIVVEHVRIQASSGKEEGKRPMRASPEPPKVSKSKATSATQQQQPQQRTVLPPSYMIAFLTMRHRMSPPRRSSHSGLGRKSGLGVCAWVADVDENEREEVREVEEEFDLVDYYAGLEY